MAGWLNASTLPLAPVNRTAGSADGGEPDPDKVNVCVSICKDEVEKPVVAGVNAMLNVRLSPGLSVTGRAGGFVSLKTPRVSATAI